MKISLILLLLTSSLSFAQVSDEDYRKSFCEQITKANIKKAENSDPIPGFWTILGRVYRLVLFPTSAVKMEELPTELNLNVTENKNVKGVKYLFLGLKETHLTKLEKKTIRKLKRKIKKDRKSIEKLSLFKELKKEEDVDFCEYRVSQKPEEFKLIKIFSEFAKGNEAILAKEKEAKTFKIAYPRIKFLKRKGWKIIKDMTYTQANMLLRKNGKQALFFTHATKSGKLVDSNGDVIPESFFSTLPTSINKVIMYSCYSDAVVDHYGISEQNNFQYFYPRVSKKFEFLFKNTIPLLSIKSVKKILPKNNINFSTELNQCSLTFETDALTKDFSLYLGHNLYLTSLNKDEIIHRIDFNCVLLTDQSKFEIYTNSRAKGSSKTFVGEVVLNTPENVIRGHFRNIYSSFTKKHIVSRFKFE